MNSFHGLTAEQVINALGLQPHPKAAISLKSIATLRAMDREALTTIYFLLKAGEVSHWHRVTDAEEVWCWHAGGPLELSIHPEGGDRTVHVLGMDLQDGQRPQAVVPVNAWQAAKPLCNEEGGEWTLVGCQVAPAFEFASFELASPGFEPS